MYQSFFGLAEAPFSIAPDPRYLYMSRSHQDALAHLLYGLRCEGGFVLLTGEVGTGKTTICRALLAQIPGNCDVAYIFNPALTAGELLSTICNEYGIDYPAENTSIKVFIDRINAYLLDAHARGRNTVLIIDEAQNLSAEVLEQMRLLTNLETNERKLLQIILLGQPELAEMVARPQLRQLAQRIVARYHLGALSKAEVAHYIRHRLEVSGARQNLIPAHLIGRLYRLSGGIPRVLNVLCDRALLGTYAQGREQVDRATLNKAAREVFGEPVTRRRWSLMAAAALALAAGGAVAFALYHQHIAHEAAAPVSSAVNGASPAHVQPEARARANVASALAWPRDEPIARSRAIALASLLRTWGESDAAAPACDPRARSGLRCRIARGDLAELRRLNRPAILEMRDGEGRTFFACLTALDETSATFSFGDSSRRVSLDALASQWSGHYISMWRMPPEVGLPIREGERGPSVAWLRRQLALAEHVPLEAAENPVFDQTLASKVKDYQTKHGLIADGAVGTQTLMHLAGASDGTAPTLLRD